MFAAGLHLRVVVLCCMAALAQGFSTFGAWRPCLPRPSIFADQVEMARESTISLSSANAGRRRVGKRGDGNVQRGRQSARRGGRGRQVGMGGGTRREDVQETIVLAYHKRRGLVTTHDDELGRETVYQDLEKTLSPHLRKERWHAIGRLDADTTGLLLMTNDGALVHHATQPGTKLPKCYLALCKGLLEEDQLDALRQGVELSGGLGMSAPAQVELVGQEAATSWLRITISEGKNRQIRRMLLAIGSQVIRLERISVGNVTVDDLEEGRWRMLTNAQVKSDLEYEPKTL